MTACSPATQDPLIPPDDSGTIGRWNTDAVDAAERTDPPGPDVRRVPDTHVEPPAPTCLETREDAPVHILFSKNCAVASACPCSPTDLGEAVGHFVARTQTSLDLCVMELQDFSVSNAVVDTYQAGAQTRVILDDGYADPGESYAVEDLHQAGLVPKDDGDPSRLMHAKFAVIDDEWVLISSANFSTYDAQSNANNLLAFRSPALADIFTQRFDQLWAGGFHDVGKAGPFTATVAGHPVEVWFGPSWGLVDRLVESIESADEAIHFSIFAFTLQEVKEAILARCGDVEIRGVFDEDQTNDPNSVAAYGWCAGADVRAAHITNGPGIDPDFGFKKLHHKLLIVDPGTGNGHVITGSTNWSYSAATKNDEVMVVVSHPEVVDAFEAEFQARFAEAK